MIIWRRIILSISISILVFSSRNNIIEVVFIDSIYKSWLLCRIIWINLALLEIERLSVWWTWNKWWVHSNGLDIRYTQIWTYNCWSSWKVSSLPKINISNWQIRTVCLWSNIFVKQIWLNWFVFCIRSHHYTLAF